MSRLIDADKLKAAITVDGYEHFSGCLSSSEISLLEMVMDDIDEAPTINTVLVPNYRVPSKEEWMERYCTKKQLAGYEKRKEATNGTD